MEIIFIPYGKAKVSPNVHPQEQQLRSAALLPEAAPEAAKVGAVIRREKFARRKEYNIVELVFLWFSNGFAIHQA